MLRFNNTRKPDFRNIGAINYDRYWSERGFEINRKLKEREKIILDLIQPGKRVADIGCGNSLLPVKLKEKGCIVEVGDLSKEVIKGYAAYGIDGFPVDLEHANDRQTLGQYDYMILSEVLEHIKNPEEAIKTLKSHASCFIITVPNSAFYRYRLHLMFSGRFFTQWVYHPSEHLRFWSHTDFLDWLAALGFSVIHTEASNGLSFFGFLPSPKNMWKNLFGHQMIYICVPRN